MARSNTRILPDLSALQARLEALEAENQKLKASKAASAGPRQVAYKTYTDSKGKDHAMVEFSGGGKAPFSLSFNKVQQVIDHQKDCLSVIKANKS